MTITVLIELLTSMQNQQSNALIAGLIVLAFGLLERNNYFLAILCIVLTVYIKIFGIVAFALCIFYPQKWKLALYSVLWTVILLVLPLAIVNFDQLKFLYISWKELLANDHSASDGLSVLGWFSTWFNLQLNKNMVVGIGALLFCLPLIKLKEYKNYTFRLLLLTSILLWIVIFNHKAESPTFVIAMTGVVIWFYSQTLKTENVVLLILAILLTSLSPTDLFPKFIRNEWIKPYVLKAVPCIFIWGKIVIDMLSGKMELRKEPEKTSVSKSVI
jgi:hypothetical protein